MKNILLGNEAVARGAVEAGVRVVSSYPGTPSTEITEAISQYEGLHSEWAVNEKAGLETVIGASIAGVRAMTCMKHVGLNVAADPLFTASYTGVSGGLVIVVADDPGMHSSQNEQDSRHYARAAKLPMLEPADSQECADFTRAAFELSERYDTPVMVRLTTRVAHARSLVASREAVAVAPRPYKKDMAKYVMMPAMATARHAEVEKRQAALAAAVPDLAFHHVHRGHASLGIVTSGVAYQYVREALPEASVLKLGMVWPLSVELVRAFAATVERLVIVEELDPFLETEIRAAGIACEGKDLFSLLGEYSVSQIQAVLGGRAPDTAMSCDVMPQAPGRPPVMCAGCPHKGLFLALSRLKAVVMGDIGCYTLGALAPMSAMDACVCMGASVGMAHGIAKAGVPELAGRTVAVIGDSTFIHTGIANLINAVYNRSDVTVVILDNSITGMTGHQQNPATGLDIHMQPAPALDLEALCAAIGVSSVRVVDPADTYASQRVLAEEMKKPGVSVVIGRRPCALIPTGKGTECVVVDVEKCTACGACLRLMCPALTPGADQKPVVDRDACNGCGLCIGVCRFDALSKEKK